MRILSSVAPSWTPRISYADRPSVVAEFRIRNAMVIKTGESATVEEEEQRMRGSNTLLVLLAAEARRDDDKTVPAGLSAQVLKKESRLELTGLVRLSVSSNKFGADISSDWFMYNSSSGMVLWKGSLRTNELVRFGAAQNLIFAAGASNMHLRRQKVFWFSGMGHKIWVVRARSQRDAPLTRFDSADLVMSVMHSDPANGADDVFGAELPRAKTSLEHEMKLQRGSSR
eukprot:scaffold2422_cov184-Pinguiococcus_pyrenoidosus.AAC.2